MIELRFVLRDGKRILQYREWPAGLYEAQKVGASNIEPMWQDVPLVDEE
jgi:hypothetical protein